MSALAVIPFTAVGALAAPPDGTTDSYYEDIGASVLGSWPQLGGNSAHSSKGKAGNADVLLGPAQWASDTDHLGRDIVFLSPSGVVAEEYGVFAVGTIDGFDHVIWADPATGEVRATVQVPDAVLDSYSTPAIDTRNFNILVASGSTMTAISLVLESVSWQTDLDNVVVNASPIITTDRGAADRAFITDYSLLGGPNGQLYCVNVDPFDELENPFQPGEIVWKAPLGGGTSGNTPAYADGVVYVATATGSGGSPNGRVLAFDAGAVTTPAPLWAFDNVAPLGFFGGVSAVGQHIYASSYAFHGDDRSANTVKLDASDGSLVWSKPSNRTNAMPVVTKSLVVVSGGLADDPAFPSFGTFPTIQVLSRETGDILWDTARDTWIDSDLDGEIDPGEYLSMGGWNHQPLVLTGNDSGAKLVAGSMPLTSSLLLQPYDVLWVLNLKWEPGSSAPLLLGAQFGSGTTPAYANGRIFSIGPDGISAFLR